ncbi:MAG TPA: hypothetical protein VGK48_22975 [Terriglobia bacterium]|jgi:hypothetical protein
MRKRLQQWPLVALCHLLVLHSAWGQPLPAQQGLHIVVVEGEGARNVTEQIPARPMVVRIQDANARPVGGAAVTFTAPEGGPSGEFANDSRSVRLVTGPDGIANAGPFHPNASDGPYQVVVKVEFQGQMATASILQTNVAKGGGHKKLILIFAIAGAAAAAAVAAHSNSGSSSSSSSGTTITFGGTAVGAPK